MNYSMGLKVRFQKELAKDSLAMIAKLKVKEEKGDLLWRFLTSGQCFL